MTRDELIAALRRGDASRDMQRLAADLLEPKKRGPKPGKRLTAARRRIARVEALAAELGGLPAAFQTELIKRQYYADKQFVELDWAVNVFSEFTSEG